MVALKELLMVGTRVPLLELHVCDGVVELLQWWSEQIYVCMVEIMELTQQG